MHGLRRYKEQARILLQEKGSKEEKVAISDN